LLVDFSATTPSCAMHQESHPICEVVGTYHRQLSCHTKVISS
jgi:hypothetical protein